MESRKMVSWGLGVGWLELLCNGYRISVFQNERLDEWWWWLHSSEEYLMLQTVYLENGSDGKFYSMYILTQSIF